VTGVVVATRARPAPAELPPAPDPGRPSSARGASVVAELALLALLCASLSGFGRVFLSVSGGWVGPILGTAVAVVAVCALTRRLVASPLLGAFVDLLAAGALTIWTVIPASTTDGLPLRPTWRAVGHLLGGLDAQVAAAVPPTRPLPAFLLLATFGGALMAILASWLAFRIHRPGWAVAPPVVAFLSCCLLGTPKGRDLSVALEVAAIAVWVLLAEWLRRAPKTRWLGDRRPTGVPSGLRVGLRLGALAVVVAVAVTALFSGVDGRGLLGWDPSGGGPTRVIVTPIVSLQTRLVDNPDLDVFSVHSPVPSYWQLTTLDVFTGSTWQTGEASYHDFDVTLPRHSVAAPAETRRVRETIHIERLDSPWLPVAFTPIAVSGTRRVQYNASTGSLLTERPTSDGLTYTVTSLEYLASLEPATLAAAPRVRAARAPAGSLELPADVPTPVVALARRIVAGRHSEYAKALALQDFFYQPEFHYSLDPPSDGSGVDAIDTFLFGTHTGYCQQFAGSYAVMARAVGLPTRLAIGFTTGTPEGNDDYQVTDADVHTWPEVWFPRYGWVPFEPTKGAPGAGFAIPGTTQYTGNTARTGRGSGPSGVVAPSGRVPSVTTAPSTTLPTTHVTTRIPVAGRSRFLGGGKPGPSRAATTAPASTQVRTATTGGGTWAGWVLLALAGVVALALAVNAGGAALRRRHRQAQMGHGGREALLAGWAAISEALAGAGLRRRASETLPEFATRAGALLASAGLTGDLRAAAAVVERASFADPRHPAEIGGEEIQRLDALSRRAGAAVRARMSRPARLWYRLDLRPALSSLLAPLSSTLAPLRARHLGPRRSGATSSAAGARYSPVEGGRRRRTR